MPIAPASLPLPWLSTSVSSSTRPAPVPKGCPPRIAPIPPESSDARSPRIATTFDFIAGIQPRVPPPNAVRLGAPRRQPFNSRCRTAHNAARRIAYPCSGAHFPRGRRPTGRPPTLRVTLPECPVASMQRVRPEPAVQSRPDSPALRAYAIHDYLLRRGYGGIDGTPPIFLDTGNRFVSAAPRESCRLTRNLRRDLVGEPGPAPPLELDYRPRSADVADPCWCADRSRQVEPPRNRSTGAAGLAPPGSLPQISPPTATMFFAAWLACQDRICVPSP